MANIEILDRHLADARSKVAELQAMLDEHLIETNGADDDTGRQLRADLQGHERRCTDLVRARKAVAAQNTVKAVAQRHAEAQALLKQYGSLAKRRIAAAKAIDEARAAVAAAITESVAIEDEARIVAKDIVLLSRLRESHSNGVFANVTTDVRDFSQRLLENPGDAKRVYGADHARAVENHIKQSHQRAEANLEGVVAYVPAPAEEQQPIRRDESSYAVLMRGVA